MLPKLLPCIPIQDGLKTKTSHAQDETVKLCLDLLAIEDAQTSGAPVTRHRARDVPQLQRHKHIAFLKNALGTLPSGFVAVDASRPWIIYWALMGLQVLDADVTAYRERYDVSNPGYGHTSCA